MKPEPSATVGSASADATETMLPCPSCGETDVDATFAAGAKDGVPSYNAGCMVCGMSGPDSHTPRDAADRWNALPRRGVSETGGKINVAPQAVAQSVRAPGKSAEAEDTGGRGFESHQPVGAAPLTPFAEQMAINEAGWELVRRKADTSITRCRELAEAAVNAYKASVQRQLGCAPSAERVATPRTEAAAWDAFNPAGKDAHRPQVVDADFARQIERELIERTKDEQKAIELAQMIQAAPRAYGERHMRQLCSTVISLADKLRGHRQEIKRLRSSAVSSAALTSERDFYQHWLSCVAQEVLGDERPENWEIKVVAKVRELVGKWARSGDRCPQCGTGIAFAQSAIGFAAFDETAVARAATVIAQSPLIDAPKLPPVSWEGLARAVLEAASSK